MSKWWKFWERETAPAKKYCCFSLDCSQRFSTPKDRSEHEEQVHGVLRVEKEIKDYGPKNV